MENFVKLLDLYSAYEIRSRAEALLAFDQWLNSTNPTDEGNTLSSIAEARAWIQTRTQHILDRLDPEGFAADCLVKLVGISGGLLMLTDRYERRFLIFQSTINPAPLQRDRQGQGISVRGLFTQFCDGSLSKRDASRMRAEDQNCDNFGRGCHAQV